MTNRLRVIDGVETIYIIDSNDENKNDDVDDANVNADEIDDFDTDDRETETEFIEKYYKDDIKYKEVNFMDNSESTFNFTKIGDEPFTYDEYEVEICTTKDGKTIIEKKTFTTDECSIFENDESYDYEHKFIEAVHYYPYLNLNYYDFGVVDNKLFT